MSREYPERPVAAVGAVVVDNGKVLLIRRGKPPRPGQWSLPGGGQELGESYIEAAIREAIVPAPKTTAKEGPDYNGFLSRFVAELWDPEAAEICSDSLRRTRKRLMEFKPI